MPWFDANTVPPQEPRDFEALPSGDYLCVIESTEKKATKSGNGHYLELVLQIVDGPAKGRKLWDRLNLDNPSQQAVEIARRALSAICHAVGVLQPNTPEDLCNRPLSVKVLRKLSRETGEPVNEIKGYSKAAKNDAYSQPIADQVAEAKQAPDADIPF